VATAALLVSFGYLGTLLTETTRLSAGWVPVVLALYGIGSVLGIAVGGRTADAHPTRTLALGITGVCLASGLLAIFAHQAIVTTILAFLLGAFGFGINPVLNSRVFTLAPEAATLGAAGNVASFNVGITAGPWLGGLAITAGLGYPSIGWIGLALGLAALALVAVSFTLERRTTPTPTPQDLAPAEADGAVRRLTVAQLRERHEEFIRAAGGDSGPQDESGPRDESGADTDGEAKDDGAESGGSEHESETGSDADHGTDADSGNDLKDDIEDDGGNDSGNENDVTNDSGNENDVTNENGNDTDVKDDNDTDVKDDNDNDNDNDVTNDTDTDTAENAGLPNPEKLRERIQLHKQASAILARGLGADVSSGDRERIVRAALDVLATDPWFEAFRFLQFDELVPFVRDRREAIERALAAVLKKSKAKAKGKGQESESDDTEGSEDASGEDSVVHLESGLLHRDDDAPVTGIVDTAASSAPDQGAGWESFAVGTDFTIRMSSHDEDEAEESEDAGLLAESEALFSGEIMVRAGRIERMVNTGDRSKPSEEQMADFLRQLEDAGMSLEFDLEGFAGVADQTGAQILMEHEADEAEASQDAKA